MWCNFVSYHVNYFWINLLTVPFIRVYCSIFHYFAAIARTVGHLSKSAEVMKIVNNLMKAPQLAVTMQEFSKEMIMVNNNLSCRNALNSYFSLCSGIPNYVKIVSTMIYCELFIVYSATLSVVCVYAYKHEDTHLYDACNKLTP